MSTAIDPAKRGLERTRIERGMLNFRPEQKQALPAHRADWSDPIDRGSARLPGLLAIAGHIGEPGPSPLDIPHVYNIVFFVDTSIYNLFKKYTNKQFFELFIYKNYIDVI